MLATVTACSSGDTSDVVPYSSTAEPTPPSQVGGHDMNTLEEVDFMHVRDVPYDYDGY